jgi:hypothetical protein
MLISSPDRQLHLSFHYTHHIQVPQNTKEQSFHLVTGQQQEQLHQRTY